MSEEDKDNFDNKVDEDKIEKKQPEGDNTPESDDRNESQEISQPESDIKPEEDVKQTIFDQENPETINNEKEKSDEAKESNFDANKDVETADEEKKHEVIHKKDGRLHIYVRQDKYKGELKSKNWVGRLYFEGKQKISSSGTANLEEAIPILEKWFDDVHANKENEQKISEPATTQETAAPTETTQAIVTNVTEEKKSEPATVTPNVTTPDEKETADTKAPSSFLGKLTNIKFKKPEFGKKASTPKNFKAGQGSFRKKLEGFFKSKLGKSSVQGEEILGVEITTKEIRLAQISSNKANQWVLEKFFIHPVNLPDEASVIDNSEKMGEELNLALQKSKINTPNAAIAIPVTSAIIRVVTAPLMKDDELQKAIDTNSLWENLVQLTDNLDDYSIFHQVINRNQKENTMDILFVASKLADINNYTSIIKSSGLNPVIIDVKCFALKSAVDQINQISKKIEDSNLTAVLEFGLDENYLMILYDNNPIITDIFLRGQDRKILVESQDQEEKEALVRRFITQVKQAVQDFETKYEKRIRSIKVVSDLKNVDDYLTSFRKNLLNVGFNLFDPFDGLKIPQQVENSTAIENRSYLSTVVGLAFRKLDVFGYYKFVTAVKNINLLPDRSGMIKQKKMKAFSNYAFKGLVGGVAGIYLILFALSFWHIHTYNKKLQDFNKVITKHALILKEQEKVKKELKILTTTLKLSNSLKSNKDLSYRILAQIASSVPKRVKFESVEYNGVDRVTIVGLAASDGDILKFIDNLSAQRLIRQASLSSMKLPTTKSGQVVMKGFRVYVQIKKGAI